MNVLANELTRRELADMIHAHAVQLMLAEPRLKVPQALRMAAELAVAAYDPARLAQVLENAAVQQGVAPDLAAVVSPAGGAERALS